MESMKLSDTLIVVVSVVPTLCVLAIIIGIIVYVYCRRKSAKARKEKERSQVQSPFHADKKKNDLYTKKTTPSDYNLARDNSMKSRAKSVEFTYFDESGEIEEIVGYNDEDLKRHEGTNGDTTRTDIYVNQTPDDNGNLRPSQIQGHLNLGLEGEVDGGVYRGEIQNERHLKSGDDNTTVEGYLRMSTATDASDADEYVIPDIPGDDVVYVKPDPPDRVEYVNDPNKKAYVNEAFLESKNQDFVEEGDYMEPSHHEYNDDGYIGPDPSSKSETSRPVSSDYAYADLRKEISYAKDEHSYINAQRN
ncbi:uncharacterized protein [Amphiura filiformis]|uniref:uncharacterized protein n=1 Tax=Amphiura filiformis TaxID=82378 RepID=UPI003B2110B7